MPRNPKYLWHDRALAVVVAVLAATWGRLPWRAAQRFGAGFGLVAWNLSRIVAGRDRRRALAHLEIAFPELPLEERQKLARASFRHLGITLGECLHLLRRDAESLKSHVALEGWERIESARAAGRPIVILTGHCGNWEVLAAALSIHGLPLAAVARSLDEPGLQKMLAGLRARFGTATIERGREGAARQLLGALRNGTALGMLIDQDTQVEGVWVPFFGRPAFTPVGAAKIALKQKAAVFPVFIERVAGGSHRATIHPEMMLPADATEATAAMTLEIERQIRRVPEQWVWIHRRWKRQPAKP
ncbi:MAG TPA: lysophospholipid acyltransferase family protein [Thermoanaerobaculia bacterium]|nr:lysophospholipid acyltransferase family protein [Thermoanaerobaculia bacterium]